MPIMVEREKWILYKHINNYEIIKAVASDVKNRCGLELGEAERHRMQDRLASMNMYRTRNPLDRPLDSINHRINTLEFFMFGYEDVVNRQKRFIFSPLGNLFLTSLNDEEKLKKIFATMLIAVQFQHPANGTPETFSLYPFRLLFQLMMDERLDNKLYFDEYAYLVAFVHSVTPQVYDQLVQNILIFRHLPNSEKCRLFSEDEHTYVNCVYEWQYYVKSILVSAGILLSEEGEDLIKLYHPTKPTSHSRATGRILKTGFTSIDGDILPFIQTLLNRYSCYAAPVPLNDPLRLRREAVTEIYSFLPTELLHAIALQSDASIAALELPRLIEEYSHNPENETSEEFEIALTEGFNLFSNVRAVHLGGAGRTDIECLYTVTPKKFAVEAKSTANTLMYINRGRLDEHRNAISGQYTIVITPRHAPAAERDIRNSQIVIISASTFSEYLYNMLYHDIRDIDYREFDNIITANLGKNITSQIANLTMTRFGAASPD